jgi:hypothetical protein
MVLDPLSAIGLCGNIVQFINFGSSLLSEGLALHRSVAGASPENIDLEVVARDLSSLSISLSIPYSVGGRVRVPSQDERKIQILAERCKELAEELLDIIQDLRVRPPHRAWSSFRQALKSVYKKEEVEQIQKRLQLFRDELTTRLVVVLKYVEDHCPSFTTVPLTALTALK